MTKSTNFPNKNLLKIRKRLRINRENQMNKK